MSGQVPEISSDAMGGAGGEGEAATAGDSACVAGGKAGGREPRPSPEELIARGIAPIKPEFVVDARPKVAVEAVKAEGAFAEKKSRRKIKEVRRYDKSQYGKGWDRAEWWTCCPSFLLLPPSCLPPACLLSHPFLPLLSPRFLPPLSLSQPIPPSGLPLPPASSPPTSPLFA